MKKEFKVGDKVIGESHEIKSTNGRPFNVFSSNYVREIAAVDGNKIRLFGDVDLWFYKNDFKLLKPCPTKKELMQTKTYHISWISNQVPVLTTGKNYEASSMGEALEKFKADEGTPNVEPEYIVKK